VAGHDRDDALYGSYEGAEFDAEGNRVRRGGRFAAFNCLPDEISPDAFGGDGIALNWWGGIEGGRYRPAPNPKATRAENRARVILVAFGDTPNEAYERLALAKSGTRRPRA
jgi:hypothetical protein